MQNYSNFLWLHVAKSIGSLKEGVLGSPRPRCGPSPFSLICSLLLRDLSFIFTSFKSSENMNEIVDGPYHGFGYSSLINDFFTYIQTYLEFEGRCTRTELFP